MKTYFTIYYKGEPTNWGRFNDFEQARDALIEAVKSATADLEILNDEWTSPLGIERISQIVEIDADNGDILNRYGWDA